MYSNSHHSRIPKIIHQIWWQGHDQVPAKYRNYCKKWKELNPDFQYICWDVNSAQRLFSKHFPALKSFLVRLSHIVQKVDLAKYAILYVYGGTYVDMDMEPKRPLRTFFKDYPDSKLLILKSGEGYFAKILSILGGFSTDFWYNNAFISCEPRLSPMQTLTYECMRKSILLQRYSAVLPSLLTIGFTTGPWIFTEILETRFKHHLTVIPKNLFEPCDGIGECDMHLQPIAEHKCDFSWSTSGRIFVTLTRHWKTILLLIIIVCLVKQQELDKRFHSR